MPRRRTVDLHVSEERWLVSYADFVTLLFAFFVVMYSVSQVSESKYRTLSSTLVEAFSEPERSLNPIQVGDPALASDPQVIKSEHQSDNQNALDAEGGAFDKTADLPQLSDQFSQQFADLIDDELLQVNSNEYWLQIALNDSILFSSAAATPSLEAQTIFAEVADLLKGFNNPIQIEGFTDNQPINTAQFASNWELSAARAAAVVKILANNGVSPKRLAAVGYGQYQPIAENETPEGRSQNRRVVVMIAREKMRRPQISTKSAITEAVRDVAQEQTQPYPQPQQQPPENNPQPLSKEASRQRMEALINSNEGIGLESVLTLQPIDSDATTLPVAPRKPDDIQPVELEGGGLLFSSDPDLPRNP